LRREATKGLRREKIWRDYDVHGEQEKHWGDEEAPSYKRTEGSLRISGGRKGGKGWSAWSQGQGEEKRNHSLRGREGRRQISLRSQVLSRREGGVKKDEMAAASPAEKKFPLFLGEEKGWGFLCEKRWRKENPKGGVQTEERSSGWNGERGERTKPFTQRKGESLRPVIARRR